MTENSLKNFSDSKISIIRSRLMARSLYLGGLETRDFAKMCSDNFYKTGGSGGGGGGAILKVERVKLLIFSFSEQISPCLVLFFNPFVPSASFFYPLNTSENLKVF